MNHKAVVTREAEADLAEIFRWYESRRSGLGYDFLLQVDATLRMLEQNPDLFERVRSM